MTPLEFSRAVVYVAFFVRAGVAEGWNGKTVAWLLGIAYVVGPIIFAYEDAHEVSR
jgi:hypothetical protein